MVVGNNCKAETATCQQVFKGGLMHMLRFPLSQYQATFVALAPTHLKPLKSHSEAATGPRRVAHSGLLILHSL